MMRMLVAILASLCLGVGSAADKAPTGPASPLKGKVVEVKDVADYTYLRVKTKDGETWAAVARTPVTKGAEVTIEYATVMTDFESKTLKRKFDRIVFGRIADSGATTVGAGSGARTAGAGNDMAALHAGVGKTVDAGEVKVAKATGPDARTVAEIVSGRAALKNKTIVVRGKVVKFTPEVLGKNWIHLRDGSGSAADGSHDVLVTTTDMAGIGDVVLVKGVVHTDRDLGSGYSYQVLIEEATLRK